MAISIFPFRRLTITKVGGPGYDYATERDFRRDTPPEGADRRAYRYLSRCRVYRLLESRTTSSGTTAASSLTALSASLEIISGGGLPTADTGVLTITFDGTVPTVSETGYDLTSLTGALIAANRDWDLTDCDISNDGDDLVIEGLTVTDTILGGGNLSHGTPDSYTTLDDKVTIAFEDDEVTFPGVSNVTNLEVASNGDAVPVMAYYSYIDGSIAFVFFSRDLSVLVGDDGSEISGTLEGLAFAGTSLNCSSNEAELTIEFGGASADDNEINYAGGTTGFDDELSNAVEAFQFPLGLGTGHLRDPLIFSPMLLRLA